MKIIPTATPSWYVAVGKALAPGNVLQAFANGFGHWRRRCAGRGAQINSNAMGGGDTGCIQGKLRLKRIKGGAVLTAHVKREVDASWHLGDPMLGRVCAELAKSQHHVATIVFDRLPKAIERRHERGPGARSVVPRGTGNAACMGGLAGNAGKSMAHVAANAGDNGTVRADQHWPCSIWTSMKARILVGSSWVCLFRIASGSKPSSVI